MQLQSEGTYGLTWLQRTGVPRARTRERLCVVDIGFFQVTMA